MHWTIALVSGLQVGFKKEEGDWVCKDSVYSVVSSFLYIVNNIYVYVYCTYIHTYISIYSIKSSLSPPLSTPLSSHSLVLSSVANCLLDHFQLLAAQRNVSTARYAQLFASLSYLQRTTCYAVYFRLCPVGFIGRISPAGLDDCLCSQCWWRRLQWRLRWRWRWHRRQRCP